VPWDVPLEPEQFDNLLRQIQAVKTDLASVVMFWHSPHQQPMITTKLQEHGFTNITDFYWYKANANQAGTTHFVRAVEVATIAMKGGRSLGYPNFRPTTSNATTTSPKIVLLVFLRMGAALLTLLRSPQSSLSEFSNS